MERFNDYLEHNKIETREKIRNAEEETKEKQKKIKELKKIGGLNKRKSKAPKSRLIPNCWRNLKICTFTKSSWISCLRIPLSKRWKRMSKKRTRFRSPEDKSLRNIIIRVYPKDCWNCYWGGISRLLCILRRRSSCWIFTSSYK